MLDVIRDEGEQSAYSILDLGCGYGALLDYINQNKLSSKYDYSGVDLSINMIREAKRLHPEANFQASDVLVDGLSQYAYDYIIMNGLMTEKRDLSQESMEDFMSEILRVAFAACKKGLAFNVMHHHVDWFRKDLFHLPLDRMASIVLKNCSRHFVVRSDYGLYEYTVYVYKDSE
jgi:SAM-dependent methyltransferase